VSGNPNGSPRQDTLIALWLVTIHLPLFGLQVSEAMGLQETTSLLDRKGGETYGPDNINDIYGDELRQRK
jgi:hypothetical protein